jgi:putative flavoprotein involved in K+ transport
LVEKVETIIIGAGQAGVSLSYWLGQHGREHVVLEQYDRPGSVWSRERWDSFTLVTPNWSFQLPGAEYDGTEPNGYMKRSEITNRFDRYVRDYHLPVRYGTRVTGVDMDGQMYRVKTESGMLNAKNVVVATGLYQAPKIPDFSQALPPDIQQLSSGTYRNPGQIQAGAVLVVGSGQSGCQIAEELYQNGHKVFLCTGSTGRFPRRYRGRDIVKWLQLWGFFDQTPDQLPGPQARFISNPHMTGKDGGHTINLHQFSRNGMVLLGHLADMRDGKAYFSPDLYENLAKIDEFEAVMLQKIDEFIQLKYAETPTEALEILRDGFSAPVLTELDLKAEGIGAVIWAQGYRFDYSLVHLPVVDSFGFPETQRGATRYPGLYFLGMPWLYQRKSGILLGIGQDAEFIAGRIAT